MRYPFLLLLSLSLVFYSCKQTSETDQGEETSVESKTSESEEPQNEQLVTIETEFGDMIVKLYNETPRHRDNFIKLVQENFYDSLLFHRVIKGFMIQGGDPDSKNAPAAARLGQGGPGYTIPAEIQRSLIHKKGALSAARLGDQVNPRKESSGSQFYVVHGTVFTDEMLSDIEKQMNKTFAPSVKEIYKTIGGAPHLDGDYTVFGEVVSGLDVIDQIAAAQVDPNSRPLKDIKMSMVMTIEN